MLGSVAARAREAPRRRIRLTTTARGRTGRLLASRGRPAKEAQRSDAASSQVLQDRSAEPLGNATFLARRHRQERQDNDSRSSPRRFSLTPLLKPSSPKQDPRCWTGCKPSFLRICSPTWGPPTPPSK